MLQHGLARQMEANPAGWGSHAAPKVRPNDSPGQAQRRPGYGSAYEPRPEGATGTDVRPVLAPRWGLWIIFALVTQGGAAGSLARILRLPWAAIRLPRWGTTKRDRNRRFMAGQRPVKHRWRHRRIGRCVPAPHGRNGPWHTISYPCHAPWSLVRSYFLITTT